MDDYSKGVGVFIFKEGNILLTFRIKGEQTGVWEVPAGHLRDNEEPQAAAVREVLEETGLQIEIIKDLGLYQDNQYKFICNMFVAEVQSGTLTNRDPKNHSAVEWISLSELPHNIGCTAAAGLSILKRSPMV